MCGGGTYVCMVVEHTCVWWWNVRVCGGGTYVCVVVERIDVLVWYGRNSAWTGPLLPFARNRRKNKSNHNKKAVLQRKAFLQRKTTVVIFQLDMIHYNFNKIYFYVVVN